MKKMMLCSLLIQSIFVNAQETKTKLIGIVFSNSKPLPNIHIINLNSKIGTVTNTNGAFEMYAHLNDTLYMSAIQYEKVKITVTKIMIHSQKVFITTALKTYQLKEIIVRNHHLTNDLYHDILNKPKDNIPQMNVSPADFKNLDFTGVAFEKDQTSRQGPPSIEHLVNPIGRAASIASIPNNQLIAEHKLRKKLKKQKDFPEKITALLGEKFFTDKLQIPPNKIYHFLSYCEYKKNTNLYAQNNLLAIIEILQEESKIYNTLKR